MKAGTFKINYILATLALLAGVSAAFTSHAEKNGLYPTWKYEKVGRGKERVRYISATHLADLIFSKSEDLVIIDLRDKDSFERYHIPWAVQSDPDTFPGLADGARLVVYGANDEYILQDLPRDLKKKLYILKGGIREWYRLVLFPDFVNIRVRNGEKLEKIIQKSMYFGGSPKNSRVLNIHERSSQFREGC